MIDVSEALRVNPARGCVAIEPRPVDKIGIGGKAAYGDRRVRCAVVNRAAAGDIDAAYVLQRLVERDDLLILQDLAGYDLNVRGRLPNRRVGLSRSVSIRCRIGRRVLGL